MKTLLQKPKNARIFVQRIKEIYHNEAEGFIFPLKKQYDENRRNLNMSTPNAAKPRDDGDDDGSIPATELPPPSADKGDLLECPVSGADRHVGNSSSTSRADFDESELDLSEWERTDFNASKFVTENKDGPKWKYVVRRVTIDIDTRRVIEDLRNPRNVPIKELYRPLPDGVKNIKTVLYYKDETPKSTYSNQRQYDEAVEAKPADESPDGTDLGFDTHFPPSSDLPPLDPVDHGGRNARKYKGTTRPPQIWPEVWQMLSKKKKLEEIAKYQQSLKESHIAAPALTHQENDLENVDVEPMLQELLANIDFSAPEFPRVDQSMNSTHRPKNPSHSFPFSALVARPVGKKEIAVEPKAQLALDSEWDKLVKAGVWDEQRPREWSDLSSEARKAGKTIHVGRIFEICVEKGSELPAGSPGRKFKGRSVFQGNNVKDQNFDWAVFQELGSNPASLTASKLADFYGLAEGHTIMQADAEQAYINAKLNTTETWVRLPPNRIPKRWKHLRDPVFRLVLALYGHPESGGHWEQFANAMLVKEGWKPVSVDAFRSVYWHDTFKSIMILYVDDFRIAGPKKHMTAAWKTISKNIKLGEPEASGKFLGCNHELSETIIPAGGDPWRTYSHAQLKGKTTIHLNMITYNMEEFLRSCVQKYMELANVKDLQHADTPFIDEVRADKEYFALQYKRDDASQSGKPTPKELESNTGELKPIAARIIMKVFYAARLARWDLLRAIGMLATRITKWDRWDDKRLHRLMCYVNSTLRKRMRSWRATNDTEFQHDLYVDADFAGDQKDSKSTNGVYQMISGANSHGQISAVSKKQSCVSHSTPEAEIVSADHGIRVEALPALDLIEIVLGRKTRVRVHEDNETAALAIRNGKSPAMRYLHRTHRVSISWLHDLETKKVIETLNCDTELQKADVFTKPFYESSKWETRLVEIGIWTPGNDSLRHKATPKARPKKAAKEDPPPEKVGVPATNGLKHSQKSCNRTIIEFCCGSESKLGQVNRIREAQGCTVIRITEEHDVTTEQGFNYVDKIIDECSGPTTMLMAAIPCTGGSMWTNFNVKRPGGAARLRKHLSTFRKIWRTFVHCARKLVAKGGHVVNEWPRGCKYWKLNYVRKFFEELNMDYIDFDGCKLGLVGKSTGNPIMKPWRFGSTFSEMIDEFTDFRCTKDHKHEHCAGGNTKATEGYTFPMVSKIHKAFAEHIKRKLKHAMPCLSYPHLNISHVSDIADSMSHKSLTCNKQDSHNDIISIDDCSHSAKGNLSEGITKRVCRASFALCCIKIPSQVSRSETSTQSTCNCDDIADCTCRSKLERSFTASETRLTSCSINLVAMVRFEQVPDNEFAVPPPPHIAERKLAARTRHANATRGNPTRSWTTFFMNIITTILSVTDRDGLLLTINAVEIPVMGECKVLDRLYSSNEFAHSVDLTAEALQQLRDGTIRAAGPDFNYAEATLAVFGDSTTFIKSKSGLTSTTCVKEIATKLGFKNFHDGVVPGAKLPDIRKALTSYAAQETGVTVYLVTWMGNDAFTDKGNVLKPPPDIPALGRELNGVLEVLRGCEASVMLVPTSLKSIFGYTEDVLDQLQLRILEEISLSTAPTMVVHAHDLYSAIPRKKSGSWHFDNAVVDKVADFFAGAIRAAVDTSALMRVETPIAVRYSNYRHRRAIQFAAKPVDDDRTEIIKAAAAPIPAASVPVKAETAASSSSATPLNRVEGSTSSSSTAPAAAAAPPLRNEWIPTTAEEWGSIFPSLRNDAPERVLQWFSDNLRICKSCTYYLRHKFWDDLRKEGRVYSRKDAFVPVRDLLRFVNSRASVRVDERWLLYCTRFNPKARMEVLMNEDAEVTHARCVQGHSAAKDQIDFSLFLKRAVPEDELPRSKDCVELPDQIYHGTRYDYLVSICSTGIIPAGNSKSKDWRSEADEGFRNHNHFSPLHPDHPDCRGGMRKDSPVLILIESARAHDSGVQFFFSRSGAILTEENIDPVFIARAIDARSGQLVYHRQRFVIANPPPWSWFRCQCGTWLFSGFYICPECKRHISQDIWPMGPQTEAEMPAEYEEEEEDFEEDALATERIRESAHDLGLGWNTRVKEKRPRGPQGEYVERGGQQGISAARHQAVSMDRSARKKGYRDYRDRYLHDAEFCRDQEKYGRDADFVELVLKEIPKGIPAKERKKVQLSPVVREFVEERDTLLKRKRERVADSGKGGKTGPDTSRRNAGEWNRSG